MCVEDTGTSRIIEFMYSGTLAQFMSYADKTEKKQYVLYYSIMKLTVFILQCRKIK